MRRRFELFPISLFFEADSGAGEGGASNTGSQNDDNDGGDGSGDGASGARTFTQEDVDRIISKRLARERKAWESDAEQKAQQAAMTETDKLKADKDAAEKRAQAAERAASDRLVLADAKVQALTAGVRPDRVDAVVKLMDLSDATDANGNPDSEAIKTAVEAVLTSYPEFKATTGESSQDTNANARSGNVSGASNPGAGGNKSLTLDEQYEAAQKAGNIPRMIAIKRLIQQKAQKS